MTIKKFEDLECWKKARQLAKRIYDITEEGKLRRDFALRDQMRRASISILSNIAEGFERGGDKEFLQFLAMAKGSCSEVRAQLYVALDRSYVTSEVFDDLIGTANDIGRLLSGLMKYLAQSNLRGNKYR